MMKEIGNKIMELVQVMKEPADVWAVKESQQEESENDELLRQLNNEDLVREEKTKKESVNTESLDLF